MVGQEQSSTANSGTNLNQSRTKKRKNSFDSPSQRPSTRWRTETDQQIYSSKLVDELIRLRRPDSPSATARAVRDAADRVLAVSAKGRTRWSRAILAGRLSSRLALMNKKHKKAARPSAGAKKPAPAAAARKQPPLQRKLRVLSRLVPGCRKLPLSNLLEEATDYIAALEMQVKAMTLLTALFNGGASLPPF